MARAGDGAPRSSTRQRTRIIRVRVTPDEEERVRTAATGRGHATLADYLRDRALDDAPVPRRPASLIGEFSVMGGVLTDAAELLEAAGESKLARRCREASQRIARLQRQLMAEA